VRDEIRFGINATKTNATRVLRLRAGECGTKTNLQIALLRAVGIPARFHVTRCKSESLRGIVPNWLANRMPSVVSHFWCECLLDGRWVSCDALLDRPLYESLLEKGQINLEQIPTIDWDGKSDLIPLKSWIVEDRGTLASYDDIYMMMDKSRGEEGLPPRIVERLFGWMIYWYLRRYTDKVRKKRLQSSPSED
jgi:transglutaminase-like putative cysteine protease